MALWHFPLKIPKLLKSTMVMSDSCRFHGRFMALSWQPRKHGSIHFHAIFMTLSWQIHGTFIAFSLQLHTCYNSVNHIHVPVMALSLKLQFIIQYTAFMSDSCRFHGTFFPRLQDCHQSAYHIHVRFRSLSGS